MENTLKLKKLKKLKRISQSEYRLHQKLKEKPIAGKKGKKGKAGKKGLSYNLTDGDKIDIQALIELPDPIPGHPGPKGRSIRGMPGKKGEPGKNAVGKKGDPGKRGIQGKPGDDGLNMLWQSLSTEDQTTILQQIAKHVDVKNDDAQKLKLEFGKTSQDLSLLLEGKNLSKVKIPFQKISYNNEKKILTIKEPGKADLEIMIFTGGGGGGSGISVIPTDFGVHKRYIDEKIIIQDNQVMINRPLFVDSSAGGSISVETGGEVLILTEGLY